MRISIGPEQPVPSGDFFLRDRRTSLSIYSIGQTSGYSGDGAGHGPGERRVSIVPGSFSLAPTSTTTNADGSQTLYGTWVSRPGRRSQTITWQDSVTGVQPGQSATVTQDASVQFVSSGNSGTLPLPDQFVAGEQIIGLSPATQTVAPGAPTSYTVDLSNPSSSAVTYTLSVQGLAGILGRSQLDNREPGGGWDRRRAADGRLRSRSPPPATMASQSQSAATTVRRHRYRADLVLQGQPAPPDSNSHGVVSGAFARLGHRRAGHFGPVRPPADQYRQLRRHVFSGSFGSALGGDSHASPRRQSTCRPA